ncbi:MAG: glucose dehydrogenase, partial [Planctomycetota bacterium]
MLLGACAGGLPGVRAGTPPITAVRVARGLSFPLYVTYAPGDFERVFIVEQGGTIRILKNGTLLPDPFLDISHLTVADGELGLLGLVFDPDYAENGFFYVNYTSGRQPGPMATWIVRYRVSADADRADPNSAHVILTFPQPYANHNGGWMGFGPNDGYLYIAVGDGGNQFDPDNRGQTIVDDLWGSLLRLDVRGDDFPEDPMRNYALPPDNPFVGTVGDDEI